MLIIFVGLFVFVGVGKNFIAASLKRDQQQDTVDYYLQIGQGVWVYGCMGVWVYRCMGVWVYGCVGVWVYGCMGV